MEIFLDDDEEDIASRRTWITDTTTPNKKIMPSAGHAKRTYGSRNEGMLLVAILPKMLPRVARKAAKMVMRIVTDNRGDDRAFIHTPLL